MKKDLKERKENKRLIDTRDKLYEKMKLFKSICLVFQRLFFLIKLL